MSGYQIIPSDPDLVAGWNLRQIQAGIVNDVSPNGYNGTIVGNPMSGRDRFGEFLEFDGVNDCGALSEISLSGAFTIRFVLSIAGTAQGHMTGNTSGTYKIGFNAGTYFIRITTGGTSTSPAILATTERLFVTVTRDSNFKVDLYENGGSARRLFSDVPQYGTYKFNRIGTDTYGYFAGKIYSAAIYNKAKSEAWALQEYVRFLRFSVL